MVSSHEFIPSTYDNACVAEATGVNIVSSGRCEDVDPSEDQCEFPFGDQ